MRELQQRVSSAEFTELRAYARRNTLHPDHWWAAAATTSWVVQALTGQWIPPEHMIPGKVDPEALRKTQAEAAERAAMRDARGR